MSDIVKHIVEVNYGTFFIIVLMLLLIIKSKVVDEKSKAFYIWGYIGIAALCVLDAIEMYTSKSPTPSFLRLFALYIGYLIKPFEIYLFFLVSNKKHKFSINYIFIALLAINTIVNLTCFFTTWNFYLDSANNLLRGGIGYFTHLICIIMIIIVVAMGINENTFGEKGNFHEALVVIIAAVFGMLAGLAETLHGFDGILSASMAISFGIFYVFEYLSLSRYDIATGVYNHNRFIMTTTSDSDKITGIIEIDINNLKQTNDERGHESGDIKIKSIVDSIKPLLDNSHMNMYRIGGDEFTIIFTKMPKDEINMKYLRILNLSKNHGNSFAVGVAFREDGDTIAEMIRRADKNMYANKKQTKSEEESID